MTRPLNSRWAGLSPDDVRLQPLYARVLGLQYVNPGGVLCFVFFEGAIALGILLAFAELVSWWAVLLLPASVAVMVKINDVVAGAVARSAARMPEDERERFGREMADLLREDAAVGRATVPEDPADPVTANAAGRDPVTANDAGRDAVAMTTGSGRRDPTARRSHQVDPLDPPVRQPESVRPPAPDLGDNDAGGAPPVHVHLHNVHPVEQIDRSERQWADRADQPDTPEQRSRQSATRRYE